MLPLRGQGLNYLHSSIVNLVPHFHVHIVSLRHAQRRSENIEIVVPRKLPPDHPRPAKGPLRKLLIQGHPTSRLRRRHRYHV